VNIGVSMVVEVRYEPLKIIIVECDLDEWALVTTGNAITCKTFRTYFHGKKMKYGFYRQFKEKKKCYIDRIHTYVYSDFNPFRI